MLYASSAFSPSEGLVVAAAVCHLPSMSSSQSNEQIATKLVHKTPLYYGVRHLEMRLDAATVAGTVKH